MGVSILFGTLSSLDMPVWVFTYIEVVRVIGFTWYVLVGIVIVISNGTEGQFFFFFSFFISYFSFPACSTWFQSISGHRL